MTGLHLAQLNVAVLGVPIDHPDTADFAAGLEPINAAAEIFPGFMWRMQDETGNASRDAFTSLRAFPPPDALTDSPSSDPSSPAPSPSDPSLPGP